MTKLTPQDFPMHRNIKLSPDDIGWIFDGEWCMLDNFYWDVYVRYNGYTYETSEHAFAAAKAINKFDHDFIALAGNPGVAKARGRRITLRDDWEEVKYQIMYEIVRAKMEQNEDCLEKLLETGNRFIYEGNSWGDDVWGVIGPDPSKWDPSAELHGRNALGKILMRVRKELGQ